MLRWGAFNNLKARRLRVTQIAVDRPARLNGGRAWCPWGWPMLCPRCYLAHLMHEHAINHGTARSQRARLLYGFATARGLDALMLALHKLTLGPPPPGVYMYQGGACRGLGGTHICWRHLGLEASWDAGEWGQISDLSDGWRVRSDRSQIAGRPGSSLTLPSVLVLPLVGY